MTLGVVETDTVIEALAGARERTLELVADLSDAEVEAVHSPLMSPLAWDLAHIAAYEDLWLAHRFAGRPLLREDLAAVYDAFETPRAARGDVELLDRPQAEAYLEEVRARTLEVVTERGSGDGTLFELVVRHEHQHRETMLQTIALAGLDAGPAWTPALAACDGTGLEPVDVPAGRCEIGAPDEGFAYDNERPRQILDLPAFRIGRTPVTNAAWQAWRGAAVDEPVDPDEPVVHVDWSQADAFARAHGARLPTEQEWEKAATAGLLDFVGEVWEWTASEFTGYPGFQAFPYREYSEVFFDRGYRVLRGASWATDRRVRSPHFRNWDLPQRRQIFAGLRLAWDA
ncbi:MAG: gamma-glutamyl hercynylcysteine S-oxide synthase [Verrucomicrobiota bacterium]|jgi:iron(II)-dependent oxidoreductase